MFSNIKALALPFMILWSLNLLGCQTVKEPRRGMPLDKWLGSTLGEELILNNGDDNIQVWKSGKKYYYFHYKLLKKTDTGQLMQKRIDSRRQRIL